MLNFDNYVNKTLVDEFSRDLADPYFDELFLHKKVEYEWRMTWDEIESSTEIICMLIKMMRRFWRRQTKKMTCLLLSLNAISIEVLLMMLLTTVVWHVQQHVLIIRMAHFPPYNVKFHIKWWGRIKRLRRIGELN